MALKNFKMSLDSNHPQIDSVDCGNLPFPFIDGMPVPEKLGNHEGDAWKFELVQVCHKINQLLKDLGGENIMLSNASLRQTILKDLEKLNRERDLLLMDFHDKGLEVEFVIGGFFIKDIKFQPLQRDDRDLPVDELGHSFDITIPISDDEQEMKETLRSRLAPLHNRRDLTNPGASKEDQTSLA